MKYTRVFATADGGSTLEEAGVTAEAADFVPGQPSLAVTEALQARTVSFLDVAGNYLCGSSW